MGPTQVPNPSPCSEGVSPSRSIASIVTAWRSLTGGLSRSIPDVDRRTIVACSGGADSSALLIALASATGELVVAHIVHDLRSAAETRADRRAVGELAQRLGLPFVHAEIRPKAAGGNEEDQARSLRYGVLAEFAAEQACPYVATAHHADDQLETMLMALMRGAGPTGMAGIARTRPLESGLSLIRPMLQVTRADAQQICRHADWAWREDPSNDDDSRVRAALRRTVLPELERIRPGASLRAVTAAELQTGAAELIELAASRLLGKASKEPLSLSWRRQTLGEQPQIVVGSALRQGVSEICGGQGMDRLASRTIESIVRAISDEKGSERVFEIHGARINVTRERVELSATR